MTYQNPDPGQHPGVPPQVGPPQFSPPPPPPPPAQHGYPQPPQPGYPQTPQQYQPVVIPSTGSGSWLILLLALAPIPVVGVLLPVIMGFIFYNNHKSANISHTAIGNSRNALNFALTYLIFIAVIYVAIWIPVFVPVDPYLALIILVPLGLPGLVYLIIVVVKGFSAAGRGAVYSPLLAIKFIK